MFVLGHSGAGCKLKVMGFVVIVHGNGAHGVSGLGRWWLLLAAVMGRLSAKGFFFTGGLHLGFNGVLFLDRFLFLRFLLFNWFLFDRFFLLQWFPLILNLLRLCIRLRLLLLWLLFWRLLLLLLQRFLLFGHFFLFLPFRHLGHFWQLHILNPTGGSLSQYQQIRHKLAEYQVTNDRYPPDLSPRYRLHKLVDQQI